MLQFGGALRLGLHTAERVADIQKRKVGQHYFGSVTKAQSLNYTRKYDLFILLSVRV